MNPGILAGSQLQDLRQAVARKVNTTLVSARFSSSFVAFSRNLPEETYKEPQQIFAMLIDFWGQNNENDTLPYDSLPGLFQVFPWKWQGIAKGEEQDHAGAKNVHLLILAIQLSQLIFRNF